MNTLGPRLVIAGVSSGVGKTTVATGLLAALAARGTSVAAAKVGPDFIDPGYHALACGRPGRNLDPWLCGPAAVGPLAARAGRGADLLVVEGVMGLYDGAADATPSSTADVAAALAAPVVLVVDASAMSASVAAMVRGYRDHDERVWLAGVVLNRVGSAGHEQLLRDALDALGVAVLGCLHRDDALTWRDRHLGLVPVAEDPSAVRASLGRLAARVAAGCDLDALVAVARSAPALPVGDVALPDRVGRCRIAVAAGPAFTFAYRDNLDALEAAGAELVPFDPLADTALPEGTDGLIAGGGFPEVFGEALAANAPLLARTRAAVAAGLPTWAECGGVLGLADRLDGRPMVGAVPTEGDPRRPHRARLPPGRAALRHAGRAGRHRAAGPRVPLLHLRAGGRRRAAHQPVRRAGGRLRHPPAARHLPAPPRRRRPVTGGRLRADLRRGEGGRRPARRSRGGDPDGRPRPRGLLSSSRRSARAPATRPLRCRSATT